MPKYQLKGHLNVAGASSGIIRTTIEAPSREEAQEKFKKFLLRKAEVVVESCQTEDDVRLGEMFGSFFKNFK